METIQQTLSRVFDTTLVGIKGDYKVKIKEYKTTCTNAYDIQVYDRTTDEEIESLGKYVYWGTCEENKQTVIEYLNWLETYKPNPDKLSISRASVEQFNH